jgi:glutamyl-tRNA reductase
MRLFAVGLSHRTAPIELRERVDFSRAGMAAALDALAARNVAREMAVLSTCNRSEIYVASGAPERARDEIVQFLTEYHQLPADAFAPHLFSFSDA